MVGRIGRTYRSDALVGRGRSGGGGGLEKPTLSGWRPRRQRRRREGRASEMGPGTVGEFKLSGVSSPAVVNKLGCPGPRNSKQIARPPRPSKRLGSARPARVIKMWSPRAFQANIMRRSRSVALLQSCPTELHNIYRNLKQNNGQFFVGIPQTFGLAFCRDRQQVWLDILSESQNNSVGHFVGITTQIGRALLSESQNKLVGHLLSESQKQMVGHVCRNR